MLFKDDLKILLNIYIMENRNDIKNVVCFFGKNLKYDRTLCNIKLIKKGITK